MNEQVIQQIVAPSVMVSACGLLLLSSTARLNTVLARIRAFHRERLDVWAKEAAPGSRAAQIRSLHLEGLELQTRKLHSRARLLRATMLTLFAATACNLLSVIGLGVHLMLHDAGWVYTASLAVFILGIVLVLVSMATSAVEVGRILETVTYELGRVERVCRGEDASPPPGPDVHEPQGTQL
ncbi:MAG: DUF2721 domain-containing protein [Phycisphaerales bacterium]